MSPPEIQLRLFVPGLFHAPFGDHTREAGRRAVDLAHRLRGEVVVDWDPGTPAVVARREERLGELRLSTRPLEGTDPGIVRQALVAGIRQMGIGALPWTDAARDGRVRAHRPI